MVKTGETTSTIVPLALTLSHDGEACVAGVDNDGNWIRPTPVLPAEVQGARPRYAYYQPLRLRSLPCPREDARPEDRAVLGASWKGSPLAADERACLYKRFAALGAREAFTNASSAALVQVRPQRYYHRRSTGRRTFLRLEFDDLTGERFDWIVRDIRLIGDFDPGELAVGPDAPNVFLAIGLTKPNHRFPGLFRGCHPLVVGVHPQDGSDPVV